MSGQIQDGATPFASVECENNPVYSIVVII